MSGAGPSNRRIFNRREYREGAKARREGATYRDNPYPPKTVRRVLWELGREDSPFTDNA